MKSHQEGRLGGTCLLSNTHVDKLGDFLRCNDPAVEEIRELDIFRRSFSQSYQLVIGRLTEILSLQPTGRPYKSTSSIVEKLRREKIRLSQMQDIAGCRIVVPDALRQNFRVEQIQMILGDVLIDDRREKPSNGYRAVHIISKFSGRPIEIQVRTTLQHVWAELSEKLSDTVDRNIKYGGGSPEIKGLLSRLTVLVSSVEDWEISTGKLVKQNPLLIKSGNKKRRKDLKRAAFANDDRKRMVYNLLREIQRDMLGDLRG